jgi:hypothetical protein
MHANSTNRARLVVIGLVALLLTASAALALRAGEADAVSATVLGKTKKTPKPACPGSCSVAGSVTGFQTVSNGKGSPFTVPKDGYIVAWSVDLGKPISQDIDTFNSYFPKNKYKGKPVARLSVLKPKGKGKFKLTKQTPNVELIDKLGTNPIITLGKPLRVKAGLRIGITTQTWAPYFRDGLPSQDNQFLASREKGECGDGQAKNAKPQKKLGSTRKYGCRFNGSRLLYNAYFVPKKKKK